MSRRLTSLGVRDKSNGRFLYPMRCKKTCRGFCTLAAQKVTIFYSATSVCDRQTSHKLTL